MSFCGNTAITFEKIDYALLDSFKQSLVKSALKTNSIGNYFRSLRAIYNKAIKAKLWIGRIIHSMISLLKQKGQPKEPLQGKKLPSLSKWA